MTDRPNGNPITVFELLLLLAILGMAYLNYVHCTTRPSQWTLEIEGHEPDE